MAATLGDNVKILNLGTRWAGRVASMLLADQGAEVIEIIRPGGAGQRRCARTVAPVGALSSRLERVLIYQTSPNGRSSTVKDQVDRGWWATWNISSAMSAGWAKNSSGLSGNMIGRVRGVLIAASMMK